MSAFYGDTIEIAERIAECDRTSPCFHDGFRNCLFVICGEYCATCLPNETPPASDWYIVPDEYIDDDY